MKQQRIVVIGSYLMALVMDADRIPLKGETLVGKNYRQVHGGKGSNQAVQAARLNVPTKFIGYIGNDAFGESFVELCKSEDIDTSGIVQSNDYPTGVGFITCSADGHNIITIDIGANKDLKPKSIDKLTVDINENDIVLIQFEVPLESALYAAKSAKSKGATVIVNPAPAYNLSGKDLSFIDYITPNETEARFCCGLYPSADITDEEAAKNLLELGCKNAILTLGEHGCLICNNDELKTVPAYKFDTIVDSTGAGDSFNASFAVGLSNGKSTEDACRFANAAAGLSCTIADTIPSFHKLNVVQQFIAKHTK